MQLRLACLDDTSCFRDLEYKPAKTFPNYCDRPPGYDGGRGGGVGVSWKSD